MIKIKTLEDYEDDIKSLTRKQYEAITNLAEIEKQLIETREKYYELDPSYVKVECFRCGGTGYLETEDKKKVKCDICALQKFIWMKLYKGE